MDVLINVANALYVVAYFTTNMLRLRVLTLVAAACLALYFATRPEPLWTVVGWNMFFLLLNLWQVARMLLARPRGVVRVGSPEGAPSGRGRQAAGRSDHRRTRARFARGEAVSCHGRELLDPRRPATS